MIREWQSSIANPDMADWITVAAYMLAALVAAKASSSASIRRERRDAIFWRSAAALLFFLGINELLDLQTLLTIAGRAHAKANGWYAEHRHIQYLFVVGLSLAAAVAGLAMLLLTKGSHAAVRLALLGFVFIGLFVLLRAASFHHLDDLLGSGWSRFNWGSVQEMAGILIVAAAAISYSRTTGRRRKISRPDG